MPNAELRKKYPKWAHRRDHRKKRRRRRRSRSRRRARRAAAEPEPEGVSTITTRSLLTQLLHQIMGVTAPVVPKSLKHGQNVTTGYTGANKPEPLIPVRSRAWYRKKAGWAPGAPGYGVGIAARA
jgi:hypothetical protein